jgi:hypothetical protein
MSAWGTTCAARCKPIAGFVRRPALADVSRAIKRGDVEIGIYESTRNRRGGSNAWLPIWLPDVDGSRFLLDMEGAETQFADVRVVGQCLLSRLGLASGEWMADSEG